MDSARKHKQAMKRLYYSLSPSGKQELVAALKSQLEPVQKVKLQLKQ